MATSIDGLRERWERMNPSEQRLVSILGATLVVCLVVALVAKIGSGMDAIERKNGDSRKALRSLAVFRNAKAKASSAGSEITIPDKALALDSYLEGIISEMELTSPTYPAPKESKSGDFVELSFSVELKGLDINQLTLLLEKIETGSKLVVLKELLVETNFRDKEKLDVEFKIATYKKAEAEAVEKPKDGEAAGEEG